MIFIRSDGVKELAEGATKKLLDEKGTLLGETPLYSPKINGRV